MITLEEQRKKDAWSLLNVLVKSEKLRRKSYSSLGDIKNLEHRRTSGDIQMVDLIRWCELLELPYIRKDWDGNKSCDSCWDIVYFEYHDVVFFELVDKLD